MHTSKCLRPKSSKCADSENLRTGLLPTGRRLFLLTCLLLTQEFAAGNPPALWGDLRPGPYPVGFQSVIARDYSRANLAGPDLQRTIAPRPILIAMWYPASEQPAVYIKYRDYLRVNDTEEQEFASRLAHFSLDAASRAISGVSIESATAEMRRKLDDAFNMPACTGRNLKPAAGPFPVVIYHPGAAGAFDENAVMFEFLASNGYLVISSAYQAAGDRVANDIGGPAQSIADMRFLINAARLWPFADVTRIAAIGHSAGAQHLLRWIGERTCPLRGAVSLDTTLEYTPASFKGHKELRRALADSELPMIPILLFASAERKPNFSTFDRYLSRASRFNASVSGLRHDDFLSHGLLRTILSDLPRVETVPVRRGYQAVCEIALRFLNACMEKAQCGPTALAPGAGGDAVTIRYRGPRR